MEEKRAKARKEMGMEEGGEALVAEVAVVGRTEVGKTSLIAGLFHHSPDVMKVGEPTIEIKGYYGFLAQPYGVRLWDFPGSGTFQHPNSSYFEDLKLYAFDYIIVLTCDRFMEIEYRIAQKAMEWHIEFCFVRTKAYQSLQAICQRKKITMQEASDDFRETLTLSFQEGFKDAMISIDECPPLFIVDSLAFTQRDAYHLYNFVTRKIDTSLKEMDENKLINFIIGLRKRPYHVESSFDQETTLLEGKQTMEDLKKHEDEDEDVPQPSQEYSTEDSCR